MYPAAMFVLFKSLGRDVSLFVERVVPRERHGVPFVLNEVRFKFRLNKRWRRLIESRREWCCRGRSEEAPRRLTERRNRSDKAKWKDVHVWKTTAKFTKVVILNTLCCYPARSISKAFYSQKFLQSLPRYITYSGLRGRAICSRNQGQ